MKILGMLFVLTVILAAPSVPAQKKITPVPPPISQVLSVQDQDGSGYMWFNITTGEFQCNMCEYGYAFAGKGKVQVDGFNVYLSAASDSYQIFASLNVWERQGKAVMRIFKAPDGRSDIEPFEEFWTDLNTNNNTLDCSGWKR